MSHRSNPPITTINSDDASESERNPDGVQAVAVVILAAGSSSRLGRPKQTLILQDETLLDKAVRLAHEAGCSEAVVVLGAFAESIQAECKLAGCEVVHNHRWQTGMGSSIRAGIESLGPVTGVILMTCDMPLLTSSHLKSLATSKKITASRYAGIRGVPAYFPNNSFEKLLSLNDDAGARSLLVDADTIDLEGGELDVDTPREEDLMRQHFALLKP